MVKRKPKIEMVPIDSLEAHPRNPNPGTNIEEIRESIRESGFFGAILAQTSRRRIIAGHQRWTAAKLEGLTEVPVIWDDVDDDRALVMLLSDNRTRDLAGSDDEILASVLADLPDLAGTGFKKIDLEELMARIKVPDFQPTDEAQPRLDEKNPIECPECGHKWVP